MITQKCFSIAYQGSRSTVGRNLSLVCDKARCARDAVLSGDPVSLFPRDDAMAAEGSLVRDLLFLRHDAIVVPETVSLIELDDINAILDFVCLN